MGLRLKAFVATGCVSAVLAVVLAAGVTGCTRSGASAASGRIVFVAVSYRSGQRIEVMRADGSGLSVIVSRPRNSDLEISCPRWSPDSQRVLFSLGKTQHGSLYSVKANGTGLRLLAHESAYGRCGSWSPDGTKIAFSGATSRPPWSQIFVKNLRTGSLRQLTGGHEPAFDPAWSPDGRQIAFEGLAGVNTYGFVQDLTTGKVIRLTPPLSAGELAWSPDGRLLAFDDGTAYAVRLASRATAMLVRGESASWSPDGRQVVFVRRSASGAQDIYIQSVTGAGRIRLTNSAASKTICYQPSWAPAG